MDTCINVNGLYNLATISSTYSTGDWLRHNYSQRHFNQATTINCTTLSSIIRYSSIKRDGCIRDKTQHPRRLHLVARAMAFELNGEYKQGKINQFITIEN